MYFKNCIENNKYFKECQRDSILLPRAHLAHCKLARDAQKIKGNIEDNTVESDRTRARWSDVKSCVETLKDELP
jgi:hypothetical protein